MPYGPHAADDRARMLEAIGIASVDALFDDIPEALRASTLRLDDPEPELHLAARLQALAGAQPRGPRLVPRRGRLPPLEPADRRPDAAPRRVVHGLHAVPARGQPGHAPEHLRVPVAARGADRDGRRVRLALRRRRRDRRGGAHDLPRDAPRAAARLARRPPALPRDARDLRRRGRARRPTRSRSSPTGRSPARPTSRRWSGCSPTRTARSRASSSPSPTSSGCSRTCPSVGRLAHAAGALFVAVIEPVSLAVLAPPGEYGADIAAGEGQPLGIPLNFGGPYLGHRRLHRRAGPPDPGPAGRRHDRPRRAARVRHDAPRARAGHPAREGRLEHLHEPGAARARRVRLPGDDRAPRAARRRGARAPRTRRPSRPRSRRPARPRIHAAPYLNELVVRVPDARAVHARLLDRGVLAGIPTADLLPDEPSLADGLLVCATEVTTRRRDRAVRDRAPRWSWPARRRHPRRPSRSREACDDRRRAATSSRPCSSSAAPGVAAARSRTRPPTPWTASRPPPGARRRPRCPSCPSPRSCATTSTCRTSTTRSTRASTRSGRAR